MRVGVLSVVPSPYQRDLFSALAESPKIELDVAYLEATAPDSPWPDKPLAEFEKVLPGKTLGTGRVRCHANSQLPDPLDFDAYIVNTALTALSTQRMFKRLRHHPNWFFWGELLRPNRGLKRLIQRHLAKPLGRARAIVAIGSKARDDYQNRFPESRVENLPYFCEISQFRCERPDRQTPTFLFCGQMIERKGIDLLISAFENVRALGIRARLILAGRETELSSGELHPDIELAGFHAPGDLPELFARADVFVLPSRHDGWGVVVNQAIGSGLPVISTSAVGAAIDLVEHRVNGLLIPPGEIDLLTEAIRDLAQNTDTRRSMAAASVAKAGQLDPAFGASRWVEILTCASS